MATGNSVERSLLNKRFKTEEPEFVKHQFVFVFERSDCLQRDECSKIAAQIGENCRLLLI